LTGSVTVLHGSVQGLTGAGAAALEQDWTQNSDGIPGTTEPLDWWGGSLRFADTMGTGRECLVVGAYGENDYQGAFTVIHGSATGLTGVGAQYFSQDTTGVPGTAEAGDNFGTF
jgi:hypothetical protein